MKKHQKLAFTLLEISVVSLVLGIMGIGLTKGVSIIRGAQLKSAQSLTASSPVLGTPGLALWLDASSKKSFSVGISNGTPIQSWKDINPINTAGTKATQPILLSSPLYLDRGINNLPSVSFVRSGNYCMMVSTGFDYNTENITIFIVWRPTTDGLETSSLLEKYSSGSAYPYSLATYSSGYVFSASDPDTSVFASGSIIRHNDVPHIVSAMRSKNGVMRIWVNGSQDAPDVADSTSEPTFNDSNLFIGCKPNSNQYLDGDIGEVIIFSHILKNGERKEIEKYLSQKWAIKLSAAS